MAIVYHNSNLTAPLPLSTFNPIYMLIHLTEDKTSSLWEWKLVPKTYTVKSSWSLLHRVLHPVTRTTVLLLRLLDMGSELTLIAKYSKCHCGPYSKDIRTSSNQWNFSSVPFHSAIRRFLLCFGHGLCLFSKIWKHGPQCSVGFYREWFLVWGP